MSINADGVPVAALDEDAVRSSKSPPGRWEYNAAHNAGYLFTGGEMVAVAHRDGRWQIYPTRGAHGKERIASRLQRDERPDGDKLYDRLELLRAIERRVTARRTRKASCSRC